MAESKPKITRKGFRLKFNKAAAERRKKVGNEQLKFAAGFGAVSGAGLLSAKFGKPKFRPTSVATSVITGALAGSHLASGLFVKATQKQSESKKGLNIPGALAGGIGSAYLGLGLGALAPGAAGKGIDKGIRGLSKFAKSRKAARTARESAKGSSGKVAGTLQKKSKKSGKYKDVRFVRIKGRIVPIRKKLTDG